MSDLENDDDSGDVYDPSKDKESSTENEDEEIQGDGSKDLFGSDNSDECNDEEETGPKNTVAEKALPNEPRSGTPSVGNEIIATSEVITPDTIVTILPEKPPANVAQPDEPCSGAHSKINEMAAASEAVTS